MRRLAGGMAAAGLALTWPSAAVADNAACQGGIPVAAVAGPDPVPAGRAVTTVGVVSGRFPGLDGFFIQGDGPGRAAGVFVYVPEHDRTALPRVSERVAVTGRTGRYHGRPQLEWVERIRRCGRGEVAVSPLDLPAPSSRLRALENRRVALEGPLAVSGVDELSRWGVLRLGVGGRVFHELADVAGGRPAGVLLDDGAYRRDPAPTPYLGANGTRRAGDTVTGVEGILVKAFGSWRVHPVTPPAFDRTNPRRWPAPAAAGALRLASFNLGNYFPVSGARGPRPRSARQRQAQALAAAIVRLRPDVLAVQELENDPGAVRALIGLLAQRGVHYRSADGARRLGDDAIRVGVLYRPEAVTVAAVGHLAGTVHDRPPLRVRFEAPGRKPFEVVVVHFKSKGGCRTRSPTGCGAERRRAQAMALARYVDPTDERATFVVGDINSYPSESPLTILARAGLARTTAAVPASRRYTYVYRGQAGTLDYILADPAAMPRGGRTRIWHLGADEPGLSPTAGPWGVSDHDVVYRDLTPVP